MNQEEGFVTIGGGPFSFQAYGGGPRHPQVEGILQFVQESLDNIRSIIDKTEFDELNAMENDSAPGPDGIPQGAYSCAGFEFLLLRIKPYWREVVFLIVLLRVGRSLSPRPLTSMTMEGLLDHRTPFAR